MILLLQLAGMQLRSLSTDSLNRFDTRSASRAARGIKMSPKGFHRRSTLQVIVHLQLVEDAALRPVVEAFVVHGPSRSVPPPRMLIRREPEDDAASLTQALDQITNNLMGDSI